MFESRAEVAAWAIAILVIVGMGVLVALGPFHNVNKIAAAPVGKPMIVQILSDPAAQGKYVPKTATVKVGQEIIFTNRSDAPHTVTANDRSFDSGTVNVGGVSWVFIPKKPGRYTYFCAFHPLMHGVLVVTS